MKKPKIMTIFGTRPEAIKMAPVIKKLRKENKLKTVVTVTAQHREMLDQVLDLFDIKVDNDLDIMEKEQTLTSLSINILRELEKVIRREKPNLILVHGDTTTTFAGALAAYYQKVKVGHIEAGLRTNNKYFPFPEEMNRHLTGVLTDIHFAPTQKAKTNLLAENVPPDKIFVTGNTVIDSMQEMVNEKEQLVNSQLKGIDFENKKILLITTHRRENIGEPMYEIFKAVKKIIKRNPEVEVVFPVHLNPEVKSLAEKVLASEDRIHLIKPLNYKTFVNLMARSYLILTDSGGIQEEAPGLSIPVLVLREHSERPEAIEAGTVHKVGVSRENIINTTEELLENNKKYNLMVQAENPYGDGKAVQRIINRLLFEFDLRQKPGSQFQRKGVK